jgi:DNA-binding XRE family transcriptional regulator
MGVNLARERTQLSQGLLCLGCFSKNIFLAARALLDWSQEQLASAADVSIPTIKRLEAGDGSEKILNSLAAAGVEFIEENGGGPGVRLTGTQKR